MGKIPLSEKVIECRKLTSIHWWDL